MTPTIDDISQLVDGAKELEGSDPLKALWNYERAEWEIMEFLRKVKNETPGMSLEFIPYWDGDEQKKRMMIRPNMKETRACQYLYTEILNAYVRLAETRKRKTEESKKVNAHHNI